MKKLLMVLFVMSFGLACGNANNAGRIEGTGTIEGIQVDVASGVSGTVAELLVEEGARVRKNGLLARIDEEDYRLQADVALFARDAAQAQLDLLLAGARKEDIQQARENVNAAKAVLEKAELNFNRIKNLYNSDSATKSAFDEAKAGYDIAKASYEAAGDMLEKLVSGARKEEIAAAQAQRSQAEANLNLLHKKIADCEIRSPIAGVVTNKLVEAGERIMINGQVVTVTRTDSMWISIYVKESDLGNVKIGQGAEVMIDSYPDRKFHGVVRFIAEEAEFTPKNIQTKDERVKLVFEVKIKIANEDNILKIGLPADAEIIVQ